MSLPALPRIIVFSSSLTQPGVIANLHSSLSTSKDFQYSVCSQVEELTKLVEGSDRAILFANCLAKEDIATLYNNLSQFESRVSGTKLRVIILNSLGHPRLGSLLRSRGSFEIVELPTNVKALVYKFKAALVLMHQTAQKQSALARSRANLELAVEENTRVARTKLKSAGLEVLWQSPVEFNYDVWLIPGRKNVRNLVGAWLIDLLGPGPVVGSWEEIPGVERSEEKAWAWSPRDQAEDIFQTPGGRWIFFGKQPEYSRQKNLWSLVSKHPYFAYYLEGKDDPEFIRVEYRPNEGLIILENSDFTQDLRPRIEGTLDSRIGVRTDEGATPDDGEIKWNDNRGPEGPEKSNRADYRFDARVEAKPWRNALTPEDPKGKTDFQLTEVKVPGLKSGARTFEKLEMRVEILRKNGEALDTGPDLSLYEVNITGATFMIRDSTAKVGDVYTLRTRLHAGENRMECILEWELTSVDLVLADGQLVSGLYRDENLDQLQTLLDRIHTRKKELQHFYATARDG